MPLSVLPHSLRSAAASAAQQPPPHSSQVSAVAAAPPLSAAAAAQGDGRSLVAVKGLCWNFLFLPSWHTVQSAVSGSCCPCSGSLDSGVHTTDHRCSLSWQSDRLVESAKTRCSSEVSPMEAQKLDLVLCCHHIRATFFDSAMQHDSAQCEGCPLGEIALRKHQMVAM